jgi:hypothetical protein
VSDDPAPLVPGDCDLRDYPDMPLEVQRFRDSDFVANEAPEAIVAAFLLWSASWHQVPAGSLPDSNRVLAQLAGYGRSVPGFLKVRDGALRGFIKCSDGRLYHPVIAEKALKALESRDRYRHERFQSAVRQHNKRDRDEDGGQDQLQNLSLERWKVAGRPATMADLRAFLTRDTAQCHA